VGRGHGSVVLAKNNTGRSIVSTKAGTWIDAGVTAPPRDGSSYLFMARVDDPGEKRWPVVDHWDSIEGWRASASEFGVKPLDLSHRTAIPESRSKKLGFKDKGMIWSIGAT
jgi:hypothetical protein